MFAKTLLPLIFAGLAASTTIGEIYFTIECESCTDPDDKEAADYKDVTDAILKYLEDKLDYKEGADFVISLPETYKPAEDKEKPYVCKTHDDDEFDWTRNTIKANGDNICTDVRITGIPPAVLDKMKDKLTDYMYDEDSRRPKKTFYEDAKLNAKITDYDCDADREEVDGETAVEVASETEAKACFDAFATLFGAPAYLEKPPKESVCGNKLPSFDVDAVPTEDASSKYEKNFAKALREAVEDELTNFKVDECPEGKDLKKCTEGLAELATLCANVQDSWATGLVGDISEELAVVVTMCATANEEDTSSASMVAPWSLGVLMSATAVFAL